MSEIIQLKRTAPHLRDNSARTRGEVIGQDVTDATIRQVAGWVSDKIKPPVSPIIEHLASDDGRAYIRVAFSGVESPPRSSQKPRGLAG